MVRYVGCSNLPGVGLRYFIVGNRHRGYSIRITRMGGEEKEGYVSAHFSDVFLLTCRLMRCSVFPENLSEVLEDLRYEEPEMPAVLSPQEILLIAKLSGGSQSYA